MIKQTSRTRKNNLVFFVYLFFLVNRPLKLVLWASYATTQLRTPAVRVKADWG